MPYQEILSRAWQIFKRQRALWLFGFLSACTGSTYGRIATPGFNFNFTAPSFSPRGGHPGAPLPPDMERWLHRLGAMPARTWLLIGAALLTLLIAWMLIVLVVRALADPALLRGILNSTRADEVLSSGEIFAESKRFFWRAAGFYLLVGGGGAVLAFMVFAAGAAIAILTVGIGLLCLVPLLLLAIPLIWLVELYLELALLALVVEDMPLLEAFSRGWAVLKRNFWDTVLTGLLLTVIRWGVGLVIGIIFVILAIPTFGPLIGVGIALQGHYLALLMLVGFLLLAVLLLVIGVLTGMLQTYLQSAWVLAYLHFTGGESQPQESNLPEPAPAAPSSPPAEPTAFSLA
jgi:hypothetical protein